MRDDEKMFNFGLCMLISVVCLIMFLQVCYRVQNNNLRYVRDSLDETRHGFAVAETKFSALSSGDSLRNCVVGINQKATTVSFSKTIHINDIPVVQK